MSLLRQRHWVDSTHETVASHQWELWSHYDHNALREFGTTWPLVPLNPVFRSWNISQQSTTSHWVICFYYNIQAHTFTSLLHPCFPTCESNNFPSSQPPFQSLCLNNKVNISKGNTTLGSELTPTTESGFFSPAKVNFPFLWQDFMLFDGESLLGKKSGGAWVGPLLFAGSECLRPASALCTAMTYSSLQEWCQGLLLNWRFHISCPHNKKKHVFINYFTKSDCYWNMIRADYYTWLLPSLFWELFTLLLSVFFSFNFCNRFPSKW